MKLRQIGEEAPCFEGGGGVASCCICFLPRDAGLLVDAVSVVGNWRMCAFDSDRVINGDSESSGVLRPNPSRRFKEAIIDGLAFLNFGEP